LRFASAGSQSPQYHLHAIIIHDGDETRGHYFTYIKNYKDQGSSWWKFDDHRVSVVQLEEVMRDSMGGCLKKTASNLVYVSDSLRQQLIEQK